MRTISQVQDLHDEMKKAVDSLSQFKSALSIESSEKLFDMTFFETENHEMFIDLSKSGHTAEEYMVMSSALKMKKHGFNDYVNQLFNADNVLNITEGKGATHVSDRNSEVTMNAVIADMQKVAEIYNGRFIDNLTSDGYAYLRKYTHVVNIGIGGSDVGVRMACEALQNFKQESSKSISYHFLSSCSYDETKNFIHSLTDNGTRLDKLHGVIFVVASKSLTTFETLKIIKDVHSIVNDDETSSYIINNTVLITSDSNRGIMPSGDLKIGSDILYNPEAVLYIRDSIGGRYSICSQMAFTLFHMIGSDRFKEMIIGMRDMDWHFRNADLGSNIPVLMALQTFMDCYIGDVLTTVVKNILPMYGRMKYFPEYIQQMTMESLGKQHTEDCTGSHELNSKDFNMNWGDFNEVVMGQPFQNAQHSVAQFMNSSCCDFCFQPEYIIFAQDENNGEEQNSFYQMIFQIDCFQTSKREAMLNHNRCSVISLKKLSPYNLGMLIAAYEHKVYTLAFMKGVNPYDQPHVDYPKKRLKQFAKTADKQSMLNSLTHQNSNLLKKIRVQHRS